jgi:hypothetical protein
MIKNKRLMKFSTLKLGIVFLTIGILSTVLPVSIASTVNKNVCHLPVYGGDYYCGYGSRSSRLYDGTLQVFVIGTDFSVWTRWRKNGQLSNWVSLGGKITASYKASDFQVIQGEDDADRIAVTIRGLDKKLWTKLRFANGNWTDWGRSEL